GAQAGRAARAGRSGKPPDPSNLPDPSSLPDPPDLLDLPDLPALPDPPDLCQYRRFCCLTMSNFAVSATAITAITPAWTGSDTTRSATSGTPPAMLREMTTSPLRRTSSTAREMS